MKRFKNITTGEIVHILAIRPSERWDGDEVVYRRQNPVTILSDNGLRVKRVLVKFVKPRYQFSQTYRQEL